jgi:hypothetical protein
MDRKTTQEVNGIVDDLGNLIKALEIISGEIYQNFDYIGERDCSSSITAMAEGYKYVKNQILQIK